MRVARNVSVPAFFGICILHLGYLAPITVAEEQPLWNIAWITDTQTPECEWITSLVGKVQANKPSILIHTGDSRFEWANQCAWKDVVTLMRSQSPPVEFGAGESRSRTFAKAAPAPRSHTRCLSDRHRTEG